MKKLLIVCLIAVMALSVMGLGYAKWSDTVYVNAAVNSGKVIEAFVDNSFMQKDIGSDWTCNYDMTVVEPGVEGKDVGSTTGVFVDTDTDGYLEALNVTVTNAYPCYYNEVSAKINNYGTIPVKIQYPKIKLGWGVGAEQYIEDGVVYTFNADGTIVEGATAVNMTNAGTGVMTFAFLNNATMQQHPNQVFEESFEFHVLQPAAQLSQYNFSIGIDATQWNEYKAELP